MASITKRLRDASCAEKDIELVHDILAALNNSLAMIPQSEIRTDFGRETYLNSRAILRKALGLKATGDWA